MRTEIEYGYNGKAKLTNNLNHNRAGASVDKVSPIKTDQAQFKSDIKSQFLMANVYYDFNTGSDWTPYIGAGLGYARVKSENSFQLTGADTKYSGSSSFSKSSNNFAWNLTAGVSYAVNNNLAIDASYRYADYGKVKSSAGLKIGEFKYNHSVDAKSKVRSNEFNLGIRYTF